MRTASTTISRSDACAAFFSLIAVSSIPPLPCAAANVETALYLTTLLQLRSEVTETDAVSYTHLTLPTILLV